MFEEGGQGRQAPAPSLKPSPPTPILKNFDGQCSI